MTKLEVLSFTGSSMTDAALKHVESLRDLREIRLYGMRVAGDGLKHLKELEKLEVLALTDYGSTDEGLRLKDLRSAIGISFRFNLGYFLLQYDIAYPTDLKTLGNSVNKFSINMFF